MIKKMNPDSLAVTQISDGQQLSVISLNYGARITGIDYAGRSLAPNYQNPKDYLNDPVYLGTTIVPIANRVANAQLTLEDDVFYLPANEGKNAYTVVAWVLTKSFGLLIKSVIQWLSMSLCLTYLRLECVAY